MLDHDPNDDPFAELSAEVDVKPLVSPLEFGSGAVDPKTTTNSPPTSKGKEVEDATDVTQDKTHSSENDKEGEDVVSEDD